MSSIRARLLGALVLCVLVSTVLTVVVTTVVVRDRVRDQRLAAIARAGDAAAAPLAATLPGGGPGTTRVVRTVGGPRLGRLIRGARARRFRAAVRQNGGADGVVQVDGTRFVFAARDTPDGRLVLVGPARTALAQTASLVRSVILAGLGGALVAALLAMLIARRLARPVRDVAAATHRLAAGERDVRVPVDGHDELAELGGAFNAMAADLQHARDAQRAFLLSVSHELKTPLTAIRGYAEAVADGAVTPTHGAGVIDAEAGRLERLVGDLLDLGRLEQAAFAVEAAPVRLADVAAEATARHAARAGELGVALHVTGPADAIALADHGRVLQIVSNLVENALRTSPRGGRVLVAVAPGEIAVGDDGPGLDADALPRAFERFYLRDRYRSDRSDGSGLGLALVRELARAMHGEAAVSSSPGHGATFTVRLPRAVPSARWPRLPIDDGPATVSW